MTRRRITLLIFGAITYVALCTLLVVGERALLYLPYPDAPSDPKAIGLKDFERRELTQTDIPNLVYWENHPPGNPTIILYFHGNGGGLFAHALFIANMARAGYHVVATEYPGYPSAPGSPSQQRIVANAVTLYDEVHRANPKTPIVIWGYSLGSGVATQLAAVRTPAALILEAPFTAASDRAAEMLPIVPVHWLMKDQYRSREVIGQVHAPLFILHGDEDAIVPSTHGEALFALANKPKIIRHYPYAGHLDLLKAGGHHDALDFIAKNIVRPN